MSEYSEKWMISLQKLVATLAGFPKIYNKNS